jgi:single-stranded-DNA-specific exonuclease
VRLIKEKHVCLQLQNGNGSTRFSALGWSRGSNWALRCAELGLRRGSTVDITYRLKARDNPQFPGLELELIDLKPR